MELDWAKTVMKITRRIVAQSASAAGATPRQDFARQDFSQSAALKGYPARGGRIGSCCSPALGWMEGAGSKFLSFLVCWIFMVQVDVTAQERVNRPALDENRYCLVFAHLVPRNKDMSLTGTGPDTNHLTFHVVPQVNETGQNILRMFGQPDRIEKGQKRDFWERSSNGLPSTGPVVTGDCWIFGPLTLMLQEDKVTRIWVEGNESLNKIAKIYHDREEKGK